MSTKPTQETVDWIAEATNLPRERVRSVLEALAEVVAAALAEGHKVKIPGVGILNVRELAPRAGTAPDGVAYSVPARRRVRIRPAAELQRRIAGES